MPIGVSVQPRNEIVEEFLKKEILQDVEASYREMVVLLARLVKTYGRLLPDRSRRYCDDLHITNNPLAKDKEVAGNVISKVRLFFCSLLFLVLLPIVFHLFHFHFHSSS